LKRPLISQG